MTTFVFVIIDVISQKSFDQMVDETNDRFLLALANLHCNLFIEQI